ncbi:RHS repeat-associated core domain-containing protein [Pseudomonas sp.]|uniref:RHS repeat domain-containing protein n=1 Tax=Pseudomonas sp. TaxID=306 RepID=UPI0028AE9712|nr:RHS repeat-associated core domain-containing protein [Pseudomonas sp.]
MTPENRLKAWKDLRLTYDAWGNVSERHSSNGYQRFTYDCENRLVKAETYRGHDSLSQASYEYDCLGRRIAKHVLTEDKTETTRFLWQGLRMLQEQKADLHSLYIYEQRSYAPLARVDTKPHQADEPKRYYFHTDQIGTPLEVTDDTGRMVWRAYYKTWGALEALAPREIEQNLRFQGQYCDAETGLHYNTFRYYDPVVGRFTTQDPIGLLGGKNLYRYAKNSTLWIDPLGWAPWARGEFSNWFNSASVQDIINNKSSVSDALRGTGGKHEMFPVAIAWKAKELGFTAEEIMKHVVPTEGLEFSGVSDRRGSLIPDGEYHKSRASTFFHKHLQAALLEANTKREAKEIIARHHRKHMKIGSC